MSLTSYRAAPPRANMYAQEYMNALKIWGYNAPTLRNQARLQENSKH